MTERTIALCNAVVLRNEGKYLTDLINEYEECQRIGDTTEGGMWLEEIIKENDRLSPIDRFDEEEYIIGLLVGGCPPLNE